MDKQEKRIQLEQRKKRWMDDRNRTLQMKEVGIDRSREMSQSLEHYPKTSTSPSKSNSRPRSSGPNSVHYNQRGLLSQPAYVSTARTMSEPVGDDAFLSKLTEKLAVQIRDEVQKEMQHCVSGTRAKDIVVEKMDSYLQDELQAHVCKLCLQIMLSPEHTPELLFPCGHTFCHSCLTTMMNKSHKSAWKCPYCRQHVQSVAVNQSLKELIDRFANQKLKIQQAHSKTVALEEVFPSSSASGHIERPVTRELSSSKISSKYSAAYQAAEMRRGILSHELEDAREELSIIEKRKQKLLAASDHLNSVRQEALEKIRLLNEEVELVDAHLVDQKKKQDELTNQEEIVKEKMTIMKRTISGIKNEMERMKLIAEGAQAK